MSCPEDLEIDELRQEAEDEDCDLILCDESLATLLLDLDDEDASERFANTKGIIEEVHPFIGYTRWTSKGGKGAHVQITLERECNSPTERLLLQACLGSDGKREALCLRRILAGKPMLNSLFRPRVSR